MNDQSTTTALLYYLIVGVGLVWAFEIVVFHVLRSIMRVGSRQRKIKSMSNQAETVKPKKTMEDKWKSIDSLSKWFGHAAKNVGDTSIAFLQTTRPFLISGEWNKEVRGILNQWDYGTITAHHCIEEIFKALVSFQGQKGLQKAKEDSFRHNWTVSLYEGEVLMVEKTFATHKEAASWTDNRLIEMASNAHALMQAKMENTIIRVERGEAMYRTRQVSNSPVCKTTSKTTGTLSWGQSKRGSTRVFFSRG